MVYSVTEGEDKPLKYPVMFRRWTWCCSTRSIWFLTSTPTLRPTLRRCVRSTRLLWSYRSAPGPVKGWPHGSIGCAGSPLPASKSPTMRQREVLTWQPIEGTSLSVSTGPEQIRGGFDRLAALAEAGDLKIVDVEFIHSIRACPALVRAGQIDPDLAGYDGANAGLLSQSDLDIVADAIPVGSMAAVILYDGTSIGAALTAGQATGQR